MKENPGVVETVIDMLNHILVDGETMEYILEKTGMEYQMLKQLMVKTSIDDLEGKDLESENINEKLIVTVSPPFSANFTPSNFDFFLVRRYKDNKNFIILKQQMPYGIISTGNGEVAFSGADGFVGIEPVNPSSAPGLLLPQHRVEVFNKNPDLVLKDLIEKKII